MITVRTTMQPDRDLEVSTVAELKDLARHGLIVEDSVSMSESSPKSSPTTSRQPKTTGE